MQELITTPICVWKTRRPSNFLVCFKFKPKGRKLEIQRTILLSNHVCIGVLIVFSPVSSSHRSWSGGRCWVTNFLKSPQTVVYFPQSRLVFDLGCCFWFFFFWNEGLSKCPGCIVCFDTVMEQWNSLGSAGWKGKGAPILKTRPWKLWKNWCFVTHELLSKNRLHFQALYQSEGKFHLCCLDMKSCKSCSEDTDHLDFDRNGLLFFLFLNWSQFLNLKKKIRRN